VTSSSSGPVAGESGDETIAGTLAPPTERAAPLAPGDKIGRYVVLRGVGRGAMGEVFAAYDPELDRRIALKVIGRDGQRLSAEARAMARLSHPNVVGIHDISEVRGHALIAMELVDGTTLAAWLATKPPVTKVIDAFVAAGRGLAAAHEAGIVHRDFKPANVLVEVDEDSGELGRVRVGDFGLAQAKTTKLATGEAQSRSLNDGLVGTPRYMAPEQFGDGTISARADQFSFCVALYEGLYGEAPFPGKTPAEIAASVLEGERSSVPERPDVPRRVRLACERGLSIEPSERFESMDALLAELVPRTRRRNWVLTVALVALAGAGGLVVGPEPTPKGCEPGSSLVIAVDRRERAREALVGHGMSSASWAKLNARLGQAESASAAERLEACTEHERGASSTSLLYRRLRCLDARDAEWDALVAVWESADAESAPHANHAVESVARRDCDPVETRQREESDVEGELHVELVRHRATALALQTSSKPSRALDSLDGLDLERLPASGVVADLLRIRALSLMDLGQVDRAERDLWASAARATAVDAHEPAALAWIWLIELESRLRNRPEAALRYQTIAEAHAAGSEWVLAQLYNHLGGARFRAADFAGAESDYRTALELLRNSGRSLRGQESILLNNLGSTAASQHKLEDAARLWEEALAVRELSSTDSLDPIVNLARLHTLGGDEVRGPQARRRAHAAAKQLVRGSPVIASRTALSAAGLFALAGEYLDAMEAAQDALSFLEGHAEPDPGFAAACHLEIGRLASRLGDRAAMARHLALGMDAVDDGAHVLPLYIARAHVIRAEAALEAGELDDAADFLSRAGAMSDNPPEGQHLPTSRLLRARARHAALAKGPQAALVVLRDVAPRWKLANDAPIIAARARYLLELGDQPRAEEVALQAVAAQAGQSVERLRTCFVHSTLVRATLPEPDPHAVETAKHHCNTDPPLPDLAFIQRVTGSRP